MTSDAPIEDPSDRTTTSDGSRAPAGRSRRNLLAAAGAAGAGAIAAASFAATPALAVDEGDRDGGGKDHGYDGSTSGAHFSGVYGHSTTAGAFGVWGANPNGIGVVGQSSAQNLGAVVGINDSSTAGRGVVGESTLGGYGVHGISNGLGGSGVVGSSPFGTGATLSGGVANLRLETAGAAPSGRDLDFLPGSVVADADGNLWVSTLAGRGGAAKWRKLAGPATAGAYHATDPFRAYDSRLASPGDGPLGPGAGRVVSVSDYRDLRNGDRITLDAVPVGATAVTYNITVTEPSGSGFLAVAPGNAVTYYASTINFSGGQTIANGGTVKVDSNRQIKVFSGGGVSTHFIIDVTGFYL